MTDPSVSHAKNIENPHARRWQEIARDLDVEIDSGLSDPEVAKRREVYGRNRLREAATRSAWSILIDQFESVVIVILLVAAGVAFAFGEIAEGIAICAVLVVNTGIGFVTELRARRSMESLRELGKHHVRIRRKGSEYTLQADELVPGDIVLLEGGDVVSADMRVVEANSLRVSEAPLTGESESVWKQGKPVAGEAPLAERKSMLFKGTTVTDGSAQAIVVGTGMHTQLGRISELAQEAEEEETPLEKRLDTLAGRLAYIALATVGVLAIVGLLRGKPMLVMIETAIALGVAAIPEGLPVVATIALARGMWIMARRQALINRLAAVETLGGTEVIFTDKTGTLTENQMHVKVIATQQGEQDFSVKDPPAADAHPLMVETVRLGVLCSNATLRDEDGDKNPEALLGDPTEAAILWAGLVLDMRREEVLDEFPEDREHSFDSDRMMMATVHRAEDHFLVAVKGAPESVLACCTHVKDSDGKTELDADGRKEWLETGNALASKGLRLIGTAEKTVGNPDDDPYADLCFVGIIGMMDPPRDGVREALAECRDAGIRVVMLTGDRAETALAIGKRVGLAGRDDDRAMAGQDMQDALERDDGNVDEVMQCPVFARVSPEQKMRLLEVYQQAGKRVAMTGDGVNDAPALKKAEIGVAMGKRGTDAAREAADMVLRDDAFASIVAAVEQGRIIFGNIRKSALFMLCTNVAEVLAVAVASFADIPLPLRALQILYLNVITDVFPALALSVGPGSPGIMKEPPRNEDLLERRHWHGVAAWGGVVALCVLAGLLIGIHGLGLPEKSAVTISFLTLAFSKVFFPFNLRDAKGGFMRNEITSNPWIWGAMGICTALLLAAVYFPVLSDVLNTTEPMVAGWLTIFGLALVPLALGQVWLWIRGKRV